MAKDMDTIVSLAKHRGFVFPGSDIYGGLSNTWDYGPLGVELKNNVKKAWWQKFITQSPFNVGIDAAILMNPKVWEASGHLNNFNDPMIDNKDSKIRYRADKLIEDYMQDVKGDENFIADGLSFEQMKKIIDDEGIVCPVSKTANWTEIRQFNLMFKTFQGVTEDSTNEIFLRPETAQGIFVNYKTCNVQCVKNYHLVSVKLVNHSVMKSLQVTSFSEQENLNKWNLNSSVNLVKKSNGKIIGKLLQVTG